MFDLIIVQPIINLLLFIYAILPGHNFGLALILLTILIRFAIHPLVKKQLYNGKALQELKPEIKKIKQTHKDDPQMVSKLTMELYKERKVSPLSTLGVIAVQIVVLIGLYTGLRKIAEDPKHILDITYNWLEGIGGLKDVAANPGNFDFTLFGIADLARSVTDLQGFYLPAFVLVLGSAVAQYYMGKQTLPDQDDAKTLRKLLKKYKLKDGSEKPGLQEWSGQLLKYMIPIFIFVFTYSLPSAIALYWLIAGVAGYYQQRHILNQEQSELVQKSMKSLTK